MPATTITLLPAGLAGGRLSKLTCQRQASGQPCILGRRLGNRLALLEIALDGEHLNGDLKRMALGQLVRGSIPWRNLKVRAVTPPASGTPIAEVSNADCGRVLTKMPSFSVIVPTFNRVELLKGTLKSIFAQQYTKFEIMVIDDGSTDATREWLAANCGSLRVVEESNRGPGAARNVGAREAQGEYIAFLDSDDLWFPWSLAVFAFAFQEHRRPNVLVGKFVEFENEAELLAVRQEAYETLWFPDYIASSRYPYYVGSGTCVVRRECFAGVGFLEDRLNAEDHDLILRMGTLPGFVRILAPA